MEKQLRELLRDLADDIPPQGMVPPDLRGRARWRIALITGTSLVVIVALVIGTITGVRSLQGAPKPRPAHRTPKPAPIGKPSGTIAFNASGPEGFQVYVVRPDGT